MRHVARACLAIGALAAIAHANGRPPATSTLHFKPGGDLDVVGGMTFGLAITHDGGATWQWMCEAAVGYGGIYDPSYVYSASGALFATTITGIRKLDSGGCVFAPTVLGSTFVSVLAQGPDGALYAAASDPADVSIYKSIDDGATFPTVATFGQIGDTWETLVVAPSNADRVYLSGYRLDAMNGRVPLLYRSDNGGATFAPLAVGEFTRSSSSSVLIAGVSATNADVVFARVTFVTGNVSDAIYRSIDGGQTFAQVLAVADSLNAFAVRGNGDIVAGTPTTGFFRSTDGGSNFQPLATTPVIHSSCLVESPGGVLWSCAQNYGTEHVGIAASIDGATWTSKLRYQDLQQPVACAPGSEQFDTCRSMVWCLLRTQLGITSQAIACGASVDTGMPPSADATAVARKGCCDVGGDATTIALATPIAIALGRRRSRRSRRRDAV